MEYKILYPEAFPIVSMHLHRGEAIKAESDAMIAMSPTIDVEGKREGSLLGGLARKFLSGESFFMQRLVASRGDGDVLFAHALPGGILDVDLDGSYGLIVEQGGFLAAEESIAVDTHVQGLSKGFFSGEGFFLVKLNGRGKAFVSSYGVIHPINLAAGEEVVIDNGHLVAWPDYMEYKIEKASSGWFSSITSGEGLVCRFKGPGVVLIQTRNPDAFESWVRSLMPPSN
ncbi:TIGR00266 family protein [Selenomonas sp.]|uniref:TIGR00266 family protein n=1 Tax=Selenomonas sp. TaxID=2053611 RepID=UPI0025D2715A|nr:TIGR00266 family protein [Selenomonas sp.]MCI6086357.1 TIGR00266 family protein [Selenomonas sp.]MDY3298338.1 TIGR00266 family protein [Selenomonas sp.]MDY4414866.1 TIGR00266 family protein [Selenomonas sp.]